jgi:hypothetical protein
MTEGVEAAMHSEQPHRLTTAPSGDGRHHVRSMLMRESLLDKQVRSSAETEGGELYAASLRDNQVHRITAS